MLHPGIIFLLLALFSEVVACRSPRDPSAPPLTLAIVNGVSLKENDFRFRVGLEIAKYGETSLKDRDEMALVKKNVLSRMIENRLIVDWGEKHGITLSDEDLALGLKGLKKRYTDKEFDMMLEEKNIPFLKWREMAEETLLAEKILESALSEKASVSPREISGYYKNHIDEFKVEERVRVRHIVTDTGEKAKNLHQRVLKGENFAKIALNHSLSPDRSNGGDLGYFFRGTHPQEFDDVCFSLRVGEVSPVVKSPYGYHIFKLLDKQRASTLSLDEVEPQIRIELTKEKMQKTYREWIEELTRSAQIQVMEDTLERLTF